MTFDCADRTMAGDPFNNISPGSPEFQYDSNNHPVFAHSTPVARKKINVNISCAESVIHSSTFVLPQCPAPPNNTPAVKISPSQDNVQIKQSPSSPVCDQGQMSSPSANNVFATPPGNAFSRFANLASLTPVKMIVCTNSKSRQMTTGFGTTGNRSRISHPRVVYDSRQYLNERNDRKIRDLVNTSMQTASNANVSVQTSFLENIVQDAKKEANGSRLEHSSVKVRREVELRMQLDDWCKRHYIIDRMMPVIFMALFTVSFAAIFCPLDDMADVIVRIVNRL